MLTLGSAIRRLREAAGYSQRRLATELQVQPSYVSHLEADRKEPSLDLIRRMAEVLKVPPGFLLATALWMDLPTAERETYGPILEALLGMATKEPKAHPG